jgi:hypothetical protein
MRAEMYAILVVAGRLWREIVRPGRARGLGGFAGVLGGGLGAVFWVVLDCDALKREEKRWTFADWALELLLLPARTLFFLRAMTIMERWERGRCGFVDKVT